MIKLMSTDAKTINLRLKAKAVKVLEARRDRQVIS
jgi:hypothetical protein